MTASQRFAILWVAVIANVAFITVATDHHHGIAGSVVGGLTAVIVGWFLW